MEGSSDADGSVLMESGDGTPAQVSAHAPAHVPAHVPAHAPAHVPAGEAEEKNYTVHTRRPEGLERRGTESRADDGRTSTSKAQRKAARKARKKAEKAARARDGSASP